MVCDNNQLFAVDRIVEEKLEISLIMTFFLPLNSVPGSFTGR